MKNLEKDTNLLNGKGETDKLDWITVKGTHIPVQEGQTPKEAVENRFEKKKEKHIMLGKKEYAEFCSIIRTRYTNKIPDRGRIFGEHFYYEFSYNKKDGRLTCRNKIQIMGNERRISNIERRIYRNK